MTVLPVPCLPKVVPKGKLLLKRNEKCSGLSMLALDLRGEGEVTWKKEMWQLHFVSKFDMLIYNQCVLKLKVQMNYLADMLKPFCFP